MTKKNVRVIVWGLGSMGKGIVEMLLDKKGVEISGVVVRGDKIGKSMYEILEIDRGNRDDIIAGSFEDIIIEGSADVVILCTDSFVKDSFDKMKYILNNKINVISTAEEMAYPKVSNKKLSEELDTLAKENKVSILGTGINPGFIMDLLVIALTGTAIDVESIKAERINDLSPFGPAVMKEQGVGISLEEFNKRLDEESLAGHVGFPESINMIADAIGIDIDSEIKLTRSPIVSKVDRSTNFVKVAKGEVAGCNMKGYGYSEGKLKIEMLHPQQIKPELEGIKTGDYIEIKGTPDINLSIIPEIPGGIGTIAMAVNMIPHIINARPGLKTMIDLPVPRAIMGDMRELIEK
nr:2,4-diaminopentanoate dehydrogenase [Tissierella sp.]